MIPDREIVANAEKSMMSDRSLSEEMRSGHNASLFLPHDAVMAERLPATIHPSWDHAVYACAKESDDSACIQIDGSLVEILSRNGLGVSHKKVTAFSLCEIRTILRDCAKMQSLHLFSGDTERLREICKDAALDADEITECYALPEEVDFLPVGEDDQVRFDFVVVEQEFGIRLHGGEFVVIRMNRQTGRVVIFHRDTGDRIGDGGHFEAIINSEQSRHGLSGEAISEIDGYVGEVESSVRGKDKDGRHIRHAYLNMPKRFADTISRLGRPALPDDLTI